MAEKDIETNFFIFLPHAITSDPLSDIEQGSRNSCYAGERLCFFLIAQYRGKNRATANFQTWQQRLLRLFTSVSVCCVDLVNRKDDANFGGFSFCWPVSCSKVEGEKATATQMCMEPKITSHGDIIYPLQVLLDTLPAMTRRIRLSVNVWTPELNAFHQSNACKQGDVLGYFVDHDPNDQIEELKSAFRCHVNATLPVVTPPTLRCKYLQVAGKHFLCVEVINILGEPVNLHQVDICVSSDVAVENSGIQQSGAKFHLKQHSKPRSSFLNVLPIPTCEKEKNKNPVFLRPWEHHAYLFRVIYHENELTLQKHVAVTLKGLITWNVKTLMKRDLKINTAYSLPVFNVRRSSVSVKATCQSSVIIGKRFQVKYTVTNTERDDGNVLLVWSPFSDTTAGTHTNYSTMLTEQSLICLQPQVRIGSCLSGSSHTVNVEFLAVQEGLHEVGKFMKCRWYSESDETFFPGSPVGSQSNLQFTTVSHSCQVFVKNIR